MAAFTQGQHIVRLCDSAVYFAGDCLCMTLGYCGIRGEDNCSNEFEQKTYIY